MDCQGGLEGLCGFGELPRRQHLDVLEGLELRVHLPRIIDTSVLPFEVCEQSLKQINQV